MPDERIGATEVGLRWRWRRKAFQRLRDALNGVQKAVIHTGSVRYRLTEGPRSLWSAPVRRNAASERIARGRSNDRNPEDHDMLISTAYAQDAAASPLGSLGALGQFLPLILIFGVFYFLLIRPQQQKQKEMKNMLAALKRGDRVVTGGGILGTVSKPPKPEDREIEVEIAPNLRVTVLRETLASVVKPQAANDAVPAKK